MSNTDVDGICIGLFVLGGLFIMLVSPFMTNKELFIILSLWAVITLSPVLIDERR